METSDTSHGIHVCCGRPNSSETSNQCTVELNENSVREGAEPIKCNVNNILIQKNDDIAGINEVLEEDESMKIYLNKKRLKKTELSNPPTTNSETIKEDAGDEHMSEKRVIAEDGIPMEVVENKLLEENLDSGVDFEKPSSSNDDNVLIDKSNGDTSENRDADMLTLTLPEENPRRAEDGVVLNVVTSKTDAGECPEDDVVLNLVSSKTDAGECPRVASGDACGRDIPLHHEKQSLASYAAPSFSHLDLLKDVASQFVNGSVNVTVDGAFAGHTEQKLLVLDVNGLLVDISSYVPYDYDPDDIILKKAVFKRPHCDDFLKFCFERFNVGVWSSKTKRNMEPIIDFLLRNDKRKLLFCWDQSHCTDTGFYTVEKRYKPLLLKKLKKLWDKSEPDLPWQRGVYNESNTLLLDDSPYKALSNPPYTAIFPYTYRFRDVRDNSLGPGGDLRVYLEGLAMAENIQEYVKQNPFGQRPITERNLSWGYYLKVIEASSTPPRQTDDDS